MCILCVGKSEQRDRGVGAGVNATMLIIIVVYYES